MDAEVIKCIEQTTMNKVINRSQVLKLFSSIIHILNPITK